MLKQLLFLKELKEQICFSRGLKIEINFQIHPLYTDNVLLPALPEDVDNEPLGSSAPLYKAEAGIW